MTIGSLEIETSLALQDDLFHLVQLRQRRQQRPRFRDLPHFRRRGEALERGREDGVGFG